MSAVQRVDIKTGFGCNNKCIFCVQGDKRDRLGDHTTDEVRQLLDDARVHADEVVFTGGEVTIRSDLEVLVRHAKRLGFRVIQIQTNGRVLSSMRFVERMVEAGATEFSPAIHGPDEAIHDLQTRAPGSFRQTVKGVLNVRALGYPVLVNSVITKMNTPYLPAMARLFVGLRVTQFQLAFVHPLGTAGENFHAVVPRLTRVAPQVSTALAIGVTGGVRCMTEGIPLCFLGRFRRLAAEAGIPRTRIYDAERVVADYTEARLSAGKLRGPPCGACALVRECEGPWREYPENYGWDEFQPVAAE